jgi:hypothetical protein
MSSFHGKLLYTTKVDGMKSFNSEVNVGVYGIFKSTSASGVWEYYLISYWLKGNDIKLTEDWHTYSMDATYESIMKHAKKVQTVEDGRKLCDEYKSKWVTGSNSTIEHIRDEKLSEILDK